jgi:hypothetical protein
MTRALNMTAEFSFPFVFLRVFLPEKLVAVQVQQQHHL